MATHTTNYNLSKPETTDSQKSFMEDYASNMEIIDQNMGGGGGGHAIIDENGTDVPQEPSIQFIGNVNVTDDAQNGKTVVDIIQEVIELTQAEYDALPSSKLTNGILYCIKDASGGYIAGDGIDITSNVISLEYLKVVNGAVNLVFDDGN